MKFLNKSRLINHIERLHLDQRISRITLDLRGQDFFGERFGSTVGFQPMVKDIRPYQPGDSLRDIDWKFFGKKEQLFIKEREGNSTGRMEFSIDNSQSMNTYYQLHKPSKWLGALTIIYILGKIYLQNYDKLFISWQNQNSFNKKQIKSNYQLIEDLITLEQNLDWEIGSQTRLNSAHIFYISDFFLNPDQLHHQIRSLMKQTESISLIHIFDPFEKNLTFSGDKKILNPEIKQDTPIYTRIDQVKKKYTQIYSDHLNDIMKIARSYNLPFLSYNIEEDPIDFIVKASHRKML